MVPDARADRSRDRDTTDESHLGPSGQSRVDVGVEIQCEEAFAAIAQRRHGRDDDRGSTAGRVARFPGAGATWTHGVPHKRARRDSETPATTTSSTLALVAVGQRSATIGSGMLARRVGRIEVKVMYRVYAGHRPAGIALDEALTAVPEILTEHGRTPVRVAS